MRAASLLLVIFAIPSVGRLGVCDESLGGNSLQEARQEYGREVVRIRDELSAAARLASERRARAKQRLLKTYDDAIKRTTKKGDLVAANALLDEKRLLAEEPLLEQQWAAVAESPPVGRLQNGQPATARPRAVVMSPQDAKKVANALVGTWVIFYNNDRTRTYEISKQGTVFFLEEGKTGQVTVDAGSLLLDFRDGKIERLRLGNNGVLTVEHFNPASNLQHNSPLCVGTGQKN